MLVDLDGSSDQHWDAEDLREKRMFLHTEREPVSRRYTTARQLIYRRFNSVRLTFVVDLIAPSPSDDGWSFMIMM